MGIETAVRPDRELPGRARGTDPADRLVQEVGGAPGSIRAALAQPRHEDVAGAGGDREEGVIAAHSRVPVMEGALLCEAVCLADRRVEVDRERR